MSKSWYSRINELELKDGSTKIEHHLVFETDSKEIKKRWKAFSKASWTEKKIVNGLNMIIGLFAL